jgi:hypothetical protein
LIVNETPNPKKRWEGKKKEGKRRGFEKRKKRRTAGSLAEGSK